jgi:hypothetical protein
MHEHHKRRTFVGRQASETMTKAYVKLTWPYLFLQDRCRCFGDASADAQTSAFNMSRQWLASRCGTNCLNGSGG